MRNEEKQILGKEVQTHYREYVYFFNEDTVCPVNTV